MKDVNRLGWGQRIGVHVGEHALAPKSLIVLYCNRIASAF